MFKSVFTKNFSLLLVNHKQMGNIFYYATTYYSLYCRIIYILCNTFHNKVLRILCCFINMFLYLNRFLLSYYLLLLICYHVRNFIYRWSVLIITNMKCNSCSCLGSFIARIIYIIILL